MRNRRVAVGTEPARADATAESDGEARDCFIETAGVSGGTRTTVEIQAVGGRACVRELAADGEWRTYPLERVKTMRRGKAGGYRWYNQYALPPVLGGGTVRLRLDQSEEERTRREPFNREEHLRWLAEREEEFDRLHGIRQDSEAGHARMKVGLPWKRALSVGWRAQELDLLGYQVLRNTVALETWRRRRGPAGSCTG